MFVAPILRWLMLARVCRVRGPILVLLLAATCGFAQSSSAKKNDGQQVPAQTAGWEMRKPASRQTVRTPHRPMRMRPMCCGN